MAEEPNESQRRSYDGNRWFERHVTEGIRDIRSHVTRIEDRCNGIEVKIAAEAQRSSEKLDRIGKELHVHSVETGERITRVEEQSKTEAKTSQAKATTRSSVIGTIGVVVAALISAIVALLIARSN